MREMHSKVVKLSLAVLARVVESLVVWTSLV